MVLKLNVFKFIHLYDDKNFATAAETITNRTAGPYFAAPLHPSVSHISQNSRESEADNCSCMHESLASLGYTVRHSRRITSRLPTENGRRRKKMSVYLIVAKNVENYIC